MGQDRGHGTQSDSDLKEFTRSSWYEQKQTPSVSKEKKEQIYGEVMMLIDEDSGDGDGGGDNGEDGVGSDGDDDGGVGSDDDDNGDVGGVNGDDGW